MVNSLGRNVILLLEICSTNCAKYVAHSF